MRAAVPTSCRAERLVVAAASGEETTWAATDSAVLLPGMVEPAGLRRLSEQQSGHPNGLLGPAGRHIVDEVALEQMSSLGRPPVQVSPGATWPHQERGGAGCRERACPLRAGVSAGTARHLAAGCKGRAGKAHGRPGGGLPACMRAPPLWARDCEVQVPQGWTAETAESDPWGVHGRPARGLPRGRERCRNVKPQAIGEDQGCGLQRQGIAILSRRPTGSTCCASQDPGAARRRKDGLDCGESPRQFPHSRLSSRSPSLCHRLSHRHPSPSRCGVPHGSTVRIRPCRRPPTDLPSGYPLLSRGGWGRTTTWTMWPENIGQTIAFGGQYSLARPGWKLRPGIRLGTWRKPEAGAPWELIFRRRSIVRYRRSVERQCRAWRDYDSVVPAHLCRAASRCRVHAALTARNDPKMSWRAAVVSQELLQYRQQVTGIFTNGSVVGLRKQPQQRALLQHRQTQCL